MGDLSTAEKNAGEHVVRNSVKDSSMKKKQTKEKLLLGRRELILRSTG